ncbi:hypothetical protein ANO14919_131570 [Xylariales sp. No.14919]|nr:hypothetical protein ANO14919_131570 [Xylariales sp. No.14919]
MGCGGGNPRRRCHPQPRQSRPPSSIRGREITACAICLIITITITSLVPSKDGNSNGSVMWTHRTTGLPPSHGDKISFHNAIVPISPYYNLTEPSSNPDPAYLYLTHSPDSGLPPPRRAVTQPHRQLAGSAPITLTTYPHGRGNIAISPANRLRTPKFQHLFVQGRTTRLLAFITLFHWAAAVLSPWDLRIYLHVPPVEPPIPWSATPAQPQRLSALRDLTKRRRRYHHRSADETARASIRKPAGSELRHELRAVAGTMAVLRFPRQNC